MSRRYLQLDVFADRPGVGNPLAVVLDAEVLDTVIGAWMWTRTAVQLAARGADVALVTADAVGMERFSNLIEEAQRSGNDTGAVYEKFFGNFRGILIALAALLAWVAIPSSVAFRAFRRKDL